MLEENGVAIQPDQVLGLWAVKRLTITWREAIHDSKVVGLMINFDSLLRSLNWKWSVTGALPMWPWYSVVHWYNHWIHIGDEA